MSISLSIVTVCIDSAETILRAVRSVADQLGPGDQYVVVDGGSKDGTVAIVESFRDKITEKGAELLVSSEPDDGIYDAMNKGIARASGEVIGLINADDWYSPGAFDLVRRAFDETDAEIVHGALDYYADDRFFRRELVHHDFLPRRMIPHPACFVRKQAYDRLGGFSTRYRLSSDYDFMLRCFDQGVRFHMIPEPVACFSSGGRSNQGASSSHETLLVRHRHGLVGGMRYRFKLLESWIRLILRG